MMNKKPLLIALMSVAIIGMLLPTASAGFSSYIFREEFNEQTLDNSTWVNVSSPFPYEMHDGSLVLHFDSAPSHKYMTTNPIPFNRSTLHGEFNFTMYVSRFQNQSSFVYTTCGISFIDSIHNITNNQFQKHEVSVRVDTYPHSTFYNKYTYHLRAGNNVETKYATPYTHGSVLGVDTNMRFAFNITIKNGIMNVYETLYQNGKLILAYQNYIPEKNNTMVVFVNMLKLHPENPTDGYASFDSMKIGQWYSPSKVAEPYRYLITVGIFIFAIMAVFMFFADKSDLAYIVAVVSYYMSMGLFMLAFIAYPYAIYSVPSWIYALFPLSLMLIGIKEESLFNLH